MARNETTILFTYTPYSQENLDSDSTLLQKTIEIKDIVPESVAYSYSPRFVAQQTLNRMSPIYLYSGGSDKQYSFTLVMHEDAIPDQYDNIVDFVDDLKAMAYPYVDEQGLIRAQMLYFQVGDLTGIGHITMEHAWKKPFRNGRFIMVEISMTITAETIFPTVRWELGDIDEDDDVETYLTYNDTTRVSANNTALINAIRSYTGFDIPINDFILNDNITDEEKQSNINYTARFFDVATQRFSDLLERVKGLDADSEDVATMSGMVSEIQDYDFTLLTPTSNSSSRVTSFTDAKAQLEDLKDTMVEYFDDRFYHEIDINMTDDQRKSIIADIEGTINAMIDLYEEVFSYAPNS